MYPRITCEGIREGICYQKKCNDIAVCRVSSYGRSSMVGKCPEFAVLLMAVPWDISIEHLYHYIYSKTWHLIFINLIKCVHTGEVWSGWKEWNLQFIILCFVDPASHYIYLFHKMYSYRWNKWRKVFTWPIARTKLLI